MKFYCTAGRGTEIFVAKELEQVFGHDIKITATDGKSYFDVNNCGYDVKQKLLSLKTVERVFVEVLHENFQKLDRRGLLTLLHTRLQNKDTWENCISTLKHLSKSNQTYPIGAPFQHKTEGKTPLLNVVDKTLENRSRSTVSNVGTDIYVPQTGTGTAVSEVGTYTSISSTCIDCESSIPEVDIDTDLLKTDNKRRMSEVGTCTNVSHTEIDMTVPEIGTNSREQTLSGSSLAASKNIPVASELTPATKRRKLDENDTVSFRVSCRFSGFARKQLNIPDSSFISFQHKNKSAKELQRTSHQMGVLISKLLGWKIDLRHPKYEINIYLSDEKFTVGIPITDIPLSKRSYIKHCGLRTPIAWIMADLLDVCPGDVVLDPMCGSGTILIEASQMCQNAVYIGMDNDVSQLSRAAENVIHHNRRNHCMSLIHSDVRHLPLPDSSVDGVVTDAPFGQNHTVIGNLHAFYCRMLSELSRVVKPGGKVVILTSSAMVHFVTQVCAGDIICESSNIEQPSRCTSADGDNAQRQGGINHCLCNTISQIREDVTEINRTEDSVVCSKYRNKRIKCSHTEYVQFAAHLSLTLKATYNVKLGESEGCILVIQNSKEIKHF